MVFRIFGRTRGQIDVNVYSYIPTKLYLLSHYYQRIPILNKASHKTFARVVIAFLRLCKPLNIFVTILCAKNKYTHYHV